MSKFSIGDEANRTAASSHVRQHQLLYPDERVVVFLAAKFPDRAVNAERRALDVGFGSGRHLRLLADYGFQTYGIDYSRDAVEITRACLGTLPLLRELKVADIREQPFPDGFFHVIISWGSIFLRTVKDMLDDLKILQRLLAPGGRLILNFRSKDSSIYGAGTAVEGRETFILDKSAGSYAEMLYSFLDHDQAAALMRQAGFEIENTERVDLWKNQCVERHSWWIFWALKTTRRIEDPEKS